MNIRRLLRQPVLTVTFHEHIARWTLGRGTQLTAAGSVALPEGLANDAVIVDPERAGAILRTAGGFPGTARMQTVVAIPSQRSVVRILELPSLPRNQFAELVEREIRRAMPMMGDNAHVSWKAKAEVDGTVFVVVAGVPRDVLDSHVAAVEAAGLRACSADLGIVAAARAVGLPRSIIAAVEDSEAEIGIFNHGVPSIVRYVAMSSRAGTAAWADQLAEELGRTIKFYRDSHRQDDILDGIPIRIVGGAARVAAASPQIPAATGQRAELAALQVSVPDTREAPAFATNIGLAMKELAA